MAKLDIKIYPDTVLRKKAIEVRKITDSDRKLAYDMVEAMRADNGVGLAAPQVGILRRIIVIEDVEDKKQAIVLINPRITAKRGKSVFCEGCLSIPGVTNDVSRPAKVSLEAMNLDGKKISIEAAGLFARIAQHEIDHLDGILFIDRVGYFKRKKILKHLDSVKKVCIEL